MHSIPPSDAPLVAVDGSVPLRGAVRPVGDKSVSHRSLLFSALGSGTSVVRGANPGEDVVSTARCLRALGIDVRESDGAFEVRGRERRWRPATDALDCGNSGTTLRLLAGILAGQPFTSTLDGDASLRGRPMGRIARPLRRLGARVEGPTNGERPPLVITGGPLQGGEFVLDVASAQVKSCILLAAWVADVAVRVVEPGPSRDHTERMLAARGAPVRSGAGRIELERGETWAGRDVEVPADPSSAALIAAAAMLVPGSRVRLTHVMTNPTRTAFVEVLERMGAHVAWSDRIAADGEELATLEVEATPSLLATQVRPEEVPRLVDEIPALAAIAALADGVTVFEGVEELRVKETDRIAETQSLLAAFGVRTESGPDRLVVHGSAPVRPSRPLPPSVDHRMAMTAAALALGASARDGGGPIEVDLRAAAVSDPGFALRLSSLQSGGARGER